MKKLSFMFAILLIFSALFTSCVKSDGDVVPTSAQTSETTTAAGDIIPKLSDFSIVREDNAPESVTELVKDIKKEIKSSMGFELSLKTDLVEETRYEILVGNARGTAEEYLSSLENNGYVVKTVQYDNGDIKIIVAGKSSFATSDAVKKFISIVKSDNISEILSLDITGYALRDIPKTISVFGDSITSYEGYSNDTSKNATFSNNGGGWYNSSKMTVRETWWMRTASALSLDLCVNNARPGDWCDSEYAITRSKNLHTDSGEYPDVIVVYFGINDYNKGASPAKFRGDYESVIRSMRDNYPDAYIFCCTLLPRDTTVNQKIISFNGIIKETAEKVGTEVIDLYSLIGNDYMANLASYTYDNLHPNSVGMEKMSGAIVGELTKWIDANCKKIDKE